MPASPEVGEISSHSLEVLAFHSRVLIKLITVWELAAEAKVIELVSSCSEKLGSISFWLHPDINRMRMNNSMFCFMVLS